jgi:hypothetical protein
MRRQVAGENCIMRSFITCTCNAQIKENEMGRICSTNRKKGNDHRILVGKPEEKRKLGRPSLMWMDNSKMDLREIKCGGMDWTDLV